MKFDKEAAQDQLDKASDELEKAGFADLAEKVDYFSNRLMKASVHEVPLIKRSLHRIQQEAKIRLQEVSGNKPTTKADKAAVATLNARRAAEARKATLKRRLKTIVAKRKQAVEKLEALRDKRKGRKTERDARRGARKTRLSKRS